MKVVDRYDRRWKVRRRWLPWRRRVRDVPDVPIDGGGLGDDPISAIIGLFLLVLAIPAIIVVLVLLAELLLLLVLLAFFVLIRLVLPVPWTIELWARPAKRRLLGWHLEHEVPVRGWGASRTAIRDMAGEIATGDHGGRYVPPGARRRDDAPAWEPAAADHGAPPVDLPGGTNWTPDGAGTSAGAAERASAAGSSTAPSRGADAPASGDAPSGSAPPRRTADPGPVTPNPFAQRDD